MDGDANLESADLAARKVHRVVLRVDLSGALDPFVAVKPEQGQVRGGQGRIDERGAPRAKIRRRSRGP